MSEARYYECFFDGEEINRFWGTAETVLDGETYELCAQPYYVCASEEMFNAMGIDIANGITTTAEMERLLDAYCGPVDGDADVDLVNCVYPETRACLFGFDEISDSEYYSHVG